VPPLVREKINGGHIEHRTEEERSYDIEETREFRSSEGP
jgi:hypothetical protein